MFVCRACDFDVCNGCHVAAAAAEWTKLPGWFRLQCEAGGDGEGEGAPGANPCPNPNPNTHLT